MSDLSYGYQTTVSCISVYANSLNKQLGNHCIQCMMYNSWFLLLIPYVNNETSREDTYGQVGETKKERKMTDRQTDRQTNRQTDI